MNDDRRGFIKKIALGAMAAGTASAGGGCGPGTDWAQDGSPATLSPSQANRLRLSMAHHDLPVDAWDDVLALSKLSDEVFRNPELAAHFARDPHAYLKSLGLGHVQVDLEAVEVRLAMAMGDSELRDFAMKAEYSKFIDRLDTMGLLEPGAHSPLAKRVAQDLAVSLGIPSETPTPAMMPVFPAFALLIVALITWVAAGFSVYAGIMVIAQVGFKVDVVASGLRVLQGPLSQAPGLMLARAMGGSEGEALATKQYLDASVDYVLHFLAESRAFARRNTMSETQLRSMIHESLRLQLALPAMH